MKYILLLFLPIFIFFFSSCEKEETVIVEEVALSAVVLPASFSALEPQEIIVQITTGTPCYSIAVEKTVSGKTFEYNFILTEEDNACIQVVKQHDVPVVFDPSSPGTYLLHFLIDGELHETQEIVVAENSVVGDWEVLRFEDETQNILMSAPEGEETIITFSSSGFEGRTERNEFEGEYQLKAENKILITEYYSTEAQETALGQMFYEAMRSGQTDPLPFEVEENLLTINYEEGHYMVLSR